MSVVILDDIRSEARSQIRALIVDAVKLAAVGAYEFVNALRHTAEQKEINQEWEVHFAHLESPGPGWEPFAVTHLNGIVWRKKWSGKK